MHALLARGRNAQLAELIGLRRGQSHVIAAKSSDAMTGAQAARLAVDPRIAPPRSSPHQPGTGKTQLLPGLSAKSYFGCAFEAG